ncbi:hypothetical protein HY448_00400 [Candidatus Pacearchaeota archaeon]|nr:hypothetical protein [Candidatus Pacearchaeota archaeon]
MRLERVMVTMHIGQIDQKYVEGTMMTSIRTLSDDQFPMGYDYQSARRKGEIWREIIVTTKDLHTIVYKVLDYRAGGDILGEEIFGEFNVPSPSEGKYHPINPHPSETL